MAYSDDYVTLTFQHLHYFVRVAELGMMTLAPTRMDPRLAVAYIIFLNLKPRASASVVR